MKRTSWWGKQRGWLAVGLALGLAGCATVPAPRASKADFSAMRSFYVVRPADETRGIDAVIVRELDLLGLSATSGAAEAKPAGAEAEVRYVARWVDGNLFKLEIEIRPSATAREAVRAESYLQRKQAGGMVQELLEILLP
eukprot:gene12596-16038_t